jgi:hypothetical protein
MLLFFTKKLVAFIWIMTGYVLDNTKSACSEQFDERSLIMKRKLFYGIPLALAIFIGGCSAETDQENEPPVEDTENDVEDEDFKLDDDKSDSDGE